MFSAVACHGAIPGMYRNGKKPFGCAGPTNLSHPLSKYMKLVNSTLTFENKSRTYRPGETLSGIFTVLSLPDAPLQEINGLYIEFEGRIFSVENEKRYFFNNGSTDIFYRFPLYEADVPYGRESDAKQIGPLKEGEYRFSFKVPKECPETFVGKYGSIKYTVKCVVQQTIDGSFAFKPSDMTIISKAVRQWENHKQMIVPMFAEKTFSSFLMLGGKIQITLNTDQSCYQSGAYISFTLKVANGGGETVKEMTLQFEQIVHYNFEGCNNKIEKTMLHTEIGPTVQSAATQIWSGHMKVPSNLQPSSKSIGEECFQSKTMAFEYLLRVTLIMGGSLLSNMCEDFPILIGRPLEGSLSTKRRKSAFASTIPRQEKMGEMSSNLVPPDNSRSRRLSLASLAPSLPDYASITDQSRSEKDKAPPTYSSLDLNSEG